jgi:hypothetical protein
VQISCNSSSRTTIKPIKLCAKRATHQRFTHPKRYSLQLSTPSMIHHNDPQPDEQELWQQMGDGPDNHAPVGVDQWLRFPGDNSEDDEGSYQDLENHRGSAAYPAAPFVDAAPATPPVSPFTAVYREILAAQNEARRAEAQERGRAALAVLMAHQPEIDDPFPAAQLPGMNGTMPGHAAGNAIDNLFACLQVTLRFKPLSISPFPLLFLQLTTAHEGPTHPYRLAPNVTHIRNCPRFRLLLELTVSSGTTPGTDDVLWRTESKLQTPPVLPT